MVKKSKSQSKSHCACPNKSCICLGGSFFYPTDTNAFKLKRKEGYRKNKIPIGFAEMEFFTDELGDTYFLRKKDEVSKNIIKNRAKDKKKPPKMPAPPVPRNTSGLATSLQKSRLKLRKKPVVVPATSGTTSGSTSTPGTTSTSGSKNNAYYANTIALIPKEYTSNKADLNIVHYLIDLYDRKNITKDELLKTPTGKNITRKELNYLAGLYIIPKGWQSTGKDAVSKKDLIDQIVKLS